MLSAMPVCAFADGFFLNVRNGFKVNETDTFEVDGGPSYRADYGHPWRVNISAGMYVTEGFCQKIICKAGISHESSPLSGRPFNSDYEYSSDQLFFEIEIRL